MRTPFAILILLLTFSAAAQPRDTSPPGSVTGFVTTVSGNLITVLNGAITIDASGASFHSRRGPVTIADVRPGVQIVAAIRNPDAPAGTLLQATNVVVLDPAAGTLTGPVQSVDAAGSALTIFGTRVLITPETRFLSPMPDRNTTIADLKAGDTVAIEVSVNGSAVTAETIRMFPPTPNASLEGTVKSIGATSWVITTRDGDVTVTVNSRTRIDPAVKVGDRVHIGGTADAAGHVTAMIIVRSFPMPVIPGGDGVEGTVKSMGATSWVITTDEPRDVTVVIDRFTRIDRAIKVGDSVIVLGRRDDSGNLVAVAIMKSGRRRGASH